MPASISHTRAADRIARLCEETQDARALRLALLDEIRRVAAFDAYSWLLTDPETEVGSAPLADVPCLPPRLIRLKYLTAVNRWTHLESAVALLSVATANHLDRSLVWREMLAGYGVNDVASMVFRDRFGCWAFLDLWRTGSGSLFSGDEVEFLTAIAAPVTAALRRCQANTFAATASFPDRSGPVVLMLSPQLEVRAQTAETEPICGRSFHPTEAASPYRRARTTSPPSSSQSRVVSTTTSRRRVCISPAARG